MSSKKIILILFPPMINNLDLKSNLESEGLGHFEVIDINTLNEQGNNLSDFFRQNLLNRERLSKDLIILNNSLKEIDAESMEDFISIVLENIKVILVDIGGAWNSMIREVFNCKQCSKSVLKSKAKIEIIKKRELFICENCDFQAEKDDVITCTEYLNTRYAENCEETVKNLIKNLGRGCLDILTVDGDWTKFFDEDGVGKEIVEKIKAIKEEKDKNH